MKRIGTSLLALVLLTVLSTAAAQLSGIVEIEMRQEGSEIYFDPVGVWVEPGTTIRFVLVDGVHDAQAYHPSNATDLMRIPEGAEPWDSGMLGGVLDTTGVFEVTLTVEGVYDYFCSPHHALGMVGRIVVGDPEASPARPLDEIPFEAAREALPTVEQILAEEVVYLHGAPGATHDIDADDVGSLRDEVVGDVLGSWGGEESIVLEHFEAAGPVELTLGAWCFEGIGFVRVDVFDADGAPVGEVMVLGEGVESVVLDTPPGAYTMEVTVSQSHIYTWELVATAAESSAGESREGGGAAPGDASAIDLPQVWEGDDFFTTEPFQAAGEWEVIFGAWCHDGVSFARATIRDEDGEEVEQVMVVGEGVRNAVLTTEPGAYTVEVWSPDMDTYHWELLVRPAGAQ